MILYRISVKNLVYLLSLRIAKEPNILIALLTLSTIVVFSHLC